MIVSLGFVVSALSFIGIIWAIVMAIMGHAITGWASMTCIVCFLPWRNTVIKSWNYRAICGKNIYGDKT